MRAFAWWAGLASYALLLALTGGAGPYLALWLWTLGALPAYVAAARRRGVGYTRILAVWLTLAVVVPLIAAGLERAGGGGVWHDTLAPLAAGLLALAILWPAVVTVLGVRLSRGRSRPAAG